MVYLHVPFCRSFCIYCDFYSEIACRDRDAQLFESYTEAVCAEASRRRDEIEATRDLDTLYIGGGTPSVLPLPHLRQMVAACCGHHYLSTGGVPPEPPASLRSEAKRQQYCYTENEEESPKPPQSLRSDAAMHRNNNEETGGELAEFTMEVNPEDIVEKGPEYVRGLLALGVNRISMGVQSLDDGILRWMNRRHDAARARQAFRILREAGVENISVDLIFGLSQLTPETLDATVAEILAWHPEHISAYQLSIEEDSALGAMVREGRYTEATQEQCAAQYALLCERLRTARYAHYEISNWALPGREAVHNSAYWTRHPYVGLGPGAHSFDGHVRSWNPEIPAFAGMAPGIPPGLSDSHSETLSEEEIREETIFLGLRTARGIPEGLCDPEKAAAALADGRLVRTGDRLRIPEDRWFVSDDILTDLI